MPNMSYCRFENTYNDLLDVYENFDKPASQREALYRSRIYNLCNRIVMEMDVDCIEVEKSGEDDDL